MAKKQVALRPRSTSAEHSTHGPWQMAATSFPWALSLMHESQGLRVATDVIGRIAAGRHHAIEIGGPHLAVRLVGPYGIAELAGIDLTGFGAHGHHLGAGFLKTKVRIPDFHLLVHVIDQNGDTFSV